MFSPFTQLLRPLTAVKSGRNLSFKQFNGIKPILRRDFARLYGQPVKQTFGVYEKSFAHSLSRLSFKEKRMRCSISLGGRLKRRLRNALIVIVVGVGAYKIYHQYHHYRWFSEMSNATETIGTKPRLVVLGTGAESLQRTPFI